MSQLPPDATCCKCGVPATLMCQRCMEFYCGSDCQILDWKDHKSKCYQMPQLIPIKRMLRGGGGSNLNDSMRRPHLGSGGGGGGSAHNDSMRRGNNSYSMARNPLPTDTDEHCANDYGAVPKSAERLLRNDKDFMLRPKLVASPQSPVVVEQEIALKKLPIADGSVVYITRVLTHAEVFIAAVSCKEYAPLFEALAGKCVPYSTEDVPPAKGDFVLVNVAGGDRVNFFRAEILDTITANTFRVLDIDTGVPCSDDTPLRQMRKLNNAMRAIPIQLQRVRLIYVESIPHAVPGNKALASLKKCRLNGIDFAVKFDEKRSEVVDLIFLNKDSSSGEQSLSKKLLPLLFEKCESSTPLQSSAAAEHAGNVRQQAAQPKKLAVEELKHALPLSPPNTPVAVTAASNLTELVSDVNVTASAPKAQHPPPPKSQHFDMQSLGAKKISADEGAAAAPKMYTLEDLEIVPITVGENVPIFILDASSIFQGYITASDFGNKTFLSKMEAYLATVSKYCKTRALENAKAGCGGGGYTPRPSEICLAVYAEDGEWYRALCMEQPKKPENAKEEVFRVMFLDYGNICKVTKRETLPITEELMFPSNANMCYVSGLATKEQRMAFFKAVCTNPIINCNVSRPSAEEDTYTLEVMNLEKLIVD